MTKVCSNCKIEKDFSGFHKNKEGVYGLHPRCKVCRRNENSTPAAIKYRIEHSDQIKDTYKRYRKNHCEKERERQKKKSKEGTAKINYKYAKERAMSNGWSLEQIRQHPDLLDFYRLKIKISRLCKTKNQ